MPRAFSMLPKNCTKYQVFLKFLLRHQGIRLILKTSLCTIFDAQKSQYCYTMARKLRSFTKYDYFDMCV